MDNNNIQVAATTWMGKNKSRAEEYTKDPEKMKKLLNDASEKAKNAGPIGEILESIKLLICIVGDWITGRYKGIPIGSIIMITLALLYFVSPIDIIPDFIPVAGYLDDAIVIGLVLKQVRADLEVYKVWRDKEEAAASAQV